MVEHTDPAGVAAGLTDAQRRLILNENMFRQRYFNALIVLEIRKLVAMKVMEPVTGRDVRSSMFRPTLLGLAVRQSIQDGGQG